MAEEWERDELAWRVQQMAKTHGPHTRPWNKDHDLIGCAGELRWEQEWGFPKKQYGQPDSGADYEWRGWTFEVKCSPAPLPERRATWKMYVTLRRPIFRIYALYDYLGRMRPPEFAGWTMGEVVRTADKAAPLGSGSECYAVPMAQLWGRKTLRYVLDDLSAGREPLC